MPGAEPLERPLPLEPLHRGAGPPLRLCDRREDRQWEYGRPPLLQETYPSRRTAVIRLPAHTDAPPPFCAQHRDLGFPNRSFMLSVVEDSGFTITRALDDREENILSTPQDTVTLTPVFDREQDCWELELRW